MVDPFDKSTILDSFVAEVYSYLPRIKADIDGLLADPTQVVLLEEGHRLAHTVKNSSLMMGYANLGKVVQPIEVFLGEVIEAKSGLGTEAAATIRRCLARTSVILDGLKGEWIDDDRLVQENDTDFTRLREILEKSSLPDSPIECPAPEVIAEIESSLEESLAESSNVAEEAAALAADTPSESPPVVEYMEAVLAIEIPIDAGGLPVDLHEEPAGQEQSTSQPAAARNAAQDFYSASGWLPTVDVDLDFADEPQAESNLDWEEAAEADWQEIDVVLAEPPVDEPVKAAAAGMGVPDPPALLVPEAEEPLVKLPGVEDPPVQLPEEAPLTPVVVATDEVVEVPPEELELPVPPNGGFLDAVAQLQECRTRLDSVFGKLQDQLLEANRTMVSLMALKPVTMNMALLSDRRYAQLLSMAQSIAAPLSNFAATIGELVPVSTAIGAVATVIERVPELPVVAEEAPVHVVDGTLGDEMSPDSLAELRSAIESEVREAIANEMAAEREMAEQQEEKSRERYESDLRDRLESEIRSELAVQFAHAAQSASRPATRTLVVSDVDDEYQNPAEDLPEELIEAFRAEAEDHLASIGRDLAALEKSAGNRDILRSIRRTIHTLKGAAASMGFRVTGELAHSLEDLLDEVDEGRIEVDSTAEGLILATSNALETLVASALAGQKEDRSLLVDLKPRFEEILAPLRSSGEEAKALPLETAPQVSSDTIPIAWSGGLQVHVGIALLDEVANLVGEMVINRAVFEHRTSDLKRALGDLDLNTSRLRQLSQKLSTSYEVAALLRGGSHQRGAIMPLEGRALPPGGGGEVSTGGNKRGETPDHRAEFDELELDRYSEFHLLARELSEAASDTGTVGGEMETLVSQLDTALARQSRLNAELQGKLMRLRLVPLSNLTPRLYRAVRNVALTHGKEVELVLVGEDVEVDKTVFESVSDPLLHLMRNAVGHGIELPEERMFKGKAEKGKVTVEAYYEGNQVVIRVSDDGRGIAWKDVYEAALAKGFIDEQNDLNASQLQDLLFLPGLSTAAEVDETSGRGMGLDIVRSKVSQVRGTVQVDSTPGEGTTFTVRLPLTLVVMRVQLIKTGTEIFAIPLGHIERILRLSSQDLDDAGSGYVLDVGGQSYSVLRLDRVLGLPMPPGPAKRSVPVLIVGDDSRKAAVVVDEVLGQQEIVIKPLGNHFKSLRGLSGATILGDGHIVIILNVLDFLTEGGTPRLSAAANVSQAVDSGSLNILVVDDSPTVRRVVCNMLQKAGYNPAAARDGVEALELVQHNQPDAILLDIEMPHMDGFELLTVLRNQAAFRGIPVIILTSRSGDKHRQKARQLGANGYLVKPYKDEELISALNSVVGATLN